MSPRALLPLAVVLLALSHIPAARADFAPLLGGSETPPSCLPAGPLAADLAAYFQW
jgi:hypothetical protein